MSSSSQALISLDSLPRVLAGKLRRLRRRLAVWFAVDGLNRLMGALLAVIAIDLLIDWSFRMDRAQRGIMLVLMVGALVWVAWRFLIKPLTTRLTDEALCLEMERHGRHSEELISALEFSRTDWSQHPNVAPGLVRDTIARGVAAGEALSLKGILRQGRFRANLLLGVVLLSGVAALGVACLQTPVMATWLDRNVLLGSASWPQDFYFRVVNAEGSALRIPRGDDYTLVAEIEKGYRYLPEEVKVEFRSGAGRRLETMDRGEKGLAFRHQMISVTEPLSFRLTSNKIKSEWYQIELLRRPEIEEVELLTKPPAYTGAEIAALPPGQGPYYVLRGSSLGVRGRADKPLTSAHLVSGETRWLLEVREDRFAGEVPAEELDSGAYALEIRDLEQVLQEGDPDPRGLGLREPLRFKIRLKEDETPKIKARLHGVSGMVVSRARLPYEATLSDDYALTEVELAWQWREDTGQSEETTGSHTPQGVAGQLGQGSMTLQGAFDLEALEIPEASRLSLHLSATDNDVVTGPKTGESTKMIVRVVSEAELRDDLLRREKDQRQLVADMVDEQDQLLTDCQALAAETRDVSTLESETRGEVVRFAKRQDQLSKGILPVVERLNGMLAEIFNNKLEEEDGVLQERLRDRIILPLEAVAHQELSLAADYLDRVRRSGNAEERQVLFSAALSNQQAALARLREILVHMVKNESYQQAVNLLYEIQKSQEELRKRTEREKAELLDKVLQTEDTEDPAETGEGSDGAIEDANPETDSSSSQ